MITRSASRRSHELVRRSFRITGIQNRTCRLRRVFTSSQKSISRSSRISLCSGTSFSHGSGADERKSFGSAETSSKQCLHSDSIDFVFSTKYRCRSSVFCPVQTPSYCRSIEDGSTGSCVRRLQRRQNLRGRLPSLPPLPEQQRIVGILDEAFDGIATAKANAEKNLQNARALFESHLQSVFTQRGEGWVETTVDEISTNLIASAIPITKSDREEGEVPVCTERQASLITSRHYIFDA